MCQSRLGSAWTMVYLFVMRVKNTFRIRNISHMRFGWEGRQRMQLWTVKGTSSIFYIRATWNGEASKLWIFHPSLGNRDRLCPHRGQNNIEAIIRTMALQLGAQAGNKSRKNKLFCERNKQDIWWVETGWPNKNFYAWKHTQNNSSQQTAVSNLSQLIVYSV